MSDDWTITIALFLAGIVPFTLAGGWGSYGDHSALPWLAGFGTQADVCSASSRSGGDGGAVRSRRKHRDLPLPRAWKSERREHWLDRREREVEEHEEALRRRMLEQSEGQARCGF